MSNAVVGDDRGRMKGQVGGTTVCARAEDDGGRESRADWARNAVGTSPRHFCSSPTPVQPRDVTSAPDAPVSPREPPLPPNHGILSAGTQPKLRAPPPSTSLATGGRRGAKCECFQWLDTSLKRATAQHTKRVFLAPNSHTSPKHLSSPLHQSTIHVCRVLSQTAVGASQQSRTKKQDRSC